MGYFRVTMEGYSEGEYASAEEAKAAFIKWIEDEELDGYGRVWSDLIGVEEFDEKSEVWE